MDRRLVEAAQTGNVQVLHTLVKDNPLVLRSAALRDGETPLHIACIGGHTDFVKEVIRLRPEFCAELNRDGLSPLHIASANGDVEILRALLQVDSNLCTIKGKDRRIPLHCAAIKGRVHIMIELLSTCPDCIRDSTARGETSLHLALKNNQFEAFKFLVEYLQQHHMVESILNKKDNQGDTILHLAVSRKQYEIIELVLDKTYFPEGTVDVNLLNQRGFTPLEVLLSSGGDNEIEEILREAGGVRAEDLQRGAISRSVSVITENPTTEQQSRGNQRRQSLSEQLQNYFKYDKLRDCPGEVRNTLLVLAVLIATTTYQAVLSPPGGVWQENYIPGNNSSSSGSKNAAVVPGSHFAGQSVMGSNNMISFGLFLVFNSIGFFMSLHMINFLTCGFPLQIELQVSLFALTLTYDTCMTALTPIRGVSIFFTVLSAVLPIIISIATKFIRNNSKKLNCALRRVTPRGA